MQKYFPKTELSQADLVIGFVLIFCCFVLFFHYDITGVGWDSLNYLFGSPLDFYENAKKIRGGGQNMFGTPYPPSIYVIFSIWLYPFKLMGIIDNPHSFPIYLTYWLKALTTLIYIASACVVYKIAQVYFDSTQKAKYVATTWFVMPLALFSQFIFSQYDIFYVILTLSGFLMFLRYKPFHAALFFGTAITFKYFPAFVFVPLLLFYEKRPLQIIICLAIFYFPTLLIDLLYGQSSAFIEGVKKHGNIYRVFAASLDVGGWKIYFLFSSFTILSGLAYFTEAARNAQARVASYIYLVSSILPFLFIIWHPQWMMFLTPAIIFTTMITNNVEKFMLLDLVGMFLFVAVISLGFPNHVDLSMFRGELFFDFHLEHNPLMAKIFSHFSNYSFNVYLSGFWGYLLLQVILKYNYLILKTEAPETTINYHLVRRSLYIGLFLFILPAAYTIYKDLAGQRLTIQINNATEVPGELLKGRVFEQKFTSKGSVIDSVELFLATFSRKNSGEVLLEMIDSLDKVVATHVFSIHELEDNAWVAIPWRSLKIDKDMIYKLRLTSQTGVPGNAITWWASSHNSYSKGSALVDGAQTKTNFLFRISFNQ